MNALRRILSPLLVLALFVVGGYGLRVLTAGSIAAVRVPHPTFDDLTTAGAAAVAWVLFGYLALGAVLTLLAAVPGAVGEACGGLAEAITPRAYRRVASVALGVSVLAGPALGTVAANAAPNDAQTSVTSVGRLDLDRPGHVENTALGGLHLDLDRPGHSSLGGLHLDLDRPGSTNNTTPRATDDDPLIRPARDVDQASYTVKRGDCLWKIAADRLGPDATSAQITAEWHRWYEANRDVIGDDPDLILVGQVFQAPDSR